MWVLQHDISEALLKKIEVNPSESLLRVVSTWGRSSTQFVTYDYDNPSIAPTYNPTEFYSNIYSYPLVN